MKLAFAIEEYIRYKQALGNCYMTPARSLKAFLRQTGNVDFDEISEHVVNAFLLGHSGRATSVWFHRYYVLGSFFRFAIGRGYMQRRILPSSIPEKPPRFVPYIYSTEDMRRLLGVPDSHYSPTFPLSPDTMRTLLLVL